MTKIDTADIWTAFRAFHMGRMVRDGDRRELIDLIAASCVIDTYDSDVIGAAAEQALGIIDAQGNT